MGFLFSQMWNFFPQIILAQSPGQAIFGPGPVTDSESNVFRLERGYFGYHKAKNILLWKP